VAFHQDGGSVTARLCEKNVERSESFRWVIGADGAHSFVREYLGVPFSGETVHMSFILGDLTLEGDLPGDELAVYFVNSDVVFVGPLTSTTFRVVYACHNLGSRERPEDVTLADFDRAFERAGLRLRATGAAWKTPFHVNDRQAKRYRVGRVFLAGDAAHVHSPVAGQGMNTGIQDAANLVWKLAAVERGAPDSLLATYEEERAAVGHSVLQRTATGLRIGTTTNPVLRFLRDHVAPPLMHLRHVQDAVVGFVSETAIQYRHSGISEDHGGAGALRAGDRVPNPALGARRLLDPLARGAALLLAIGSKEADLPRETPGLSVSRLYPEGSPEIAALFGVEPAAFVVRPDGYLGYRGPLRGLAGRDGYLARIGAVAAVEEPRASPGATP
jgi:hypothetical protein